jgi:hypothetical protein
VEPQPSCWEDVYYCQTLPSLSLPTWSCPSNVKDKSHGFGMKVVCLALSCVASFVAMIRGVESSKYDNVMHLHPTAASDNAILCTPWLSRRIDRLKNAKHTELPTAGYTKQNTLC